MSREYITKCSVCDGEIMFAAGSETARCSFCGRMNSRPRKEENGAEELKYANERRNMGEFAQAEQAYRAVLQGNTEEHEARWGLLLCKYGVIYVEDGKKQERVITCRRMRSAPIRSDEDYRLVLEQAPAQVRAEYERDARYIDQVQAEIRRIREQMEPFEVFLCYKETDENGQRTVDSVLAQQIYSTLTRRGYKIFFAPISLKEMAGANYEAAIFCAIESTPVMLVLGTKAQYFESTWVRSEWRRYLEKIDLGEERLLVPLYRDLAPEKDLPQEFRHRYWEGLDMNDAGFLYDVEIILKKALKKNKETKESSWKEGYYYLEKGEFDHASLFFERFLRTDPRNAMAWLGKAMAELKTKQEEELVSIGKKLEENINFRRALRYGDEALIRRLKRYKEEAKQNNAKDIQKWTEQAEQGNAKMQFALGELYEKGGVQAEMNQAERNAEAIRWYRRAAEGGYSTAQEKLGGIYLNGTGVEKDAAEAFKWYGMCAVQDEKTPEVFAAQKCLGDMYSNGFGVEKDIDKAIWWYRKAAENGNLAAQSFLGRAYLGWVNGFPKDIQEGIKWLRKAAENRSSTAQNSLGYCCDHGIGVDIDYTEALKWFKKAAEQGDAEAQRNVGICYENGRGVEQNCSEAARWFQMAIANGCSAEKDLERVKKKMKAGQS